MISRSTIFLGWVASLQFTSVYAVDSVKLTTVTHCINVWYSIPTLSLINEFVKPFSICPGSDPMNVPSKDEFWITSGFAHDAQVDPLPVLVPKFQDIFLFNELTSEAYFDSSYCLHEKSGRIDISESKCASQCHRTDLREANPYYVVGYRGDTDADTELANRQCQQEQEIHGQNWGQTPDMAQKPAMENGYQPNSVAENPVVPSFFDAGNNNLFANSEQTSNIGNGLLPGAGGDFNVNGGSGVSAPSLYSNEGSTWSTAGRRARKRRSL